MHRGFYADSLAVSGWSVEDYPAFPGYAETVVGFAGFVAEELGGDVH